MAAGDKVPTLDRGKNDIQRLMLYFMSVVRFDLEANCV